MKYLLTFLWVLVSFIPCRAQKIKPALHLIKGNTYYLTSSGSSTIVQSIDGQENKINLTLSFRMAFKVIDITDSVYNMEVSYQTLDMKIQVADNTVDMDSQKNDKQDIPSSIAAAMMNKPFNIILTKSGKIKSVGNIEKMILSAFDGFPQLDTTKKEQIKNQFMQSFGLNAFKGSLEMGTAIFPEVKVAKNDTWTVNSSLESPVKVNVQIVYQLIDVTGDFFQIHGDGTMVTDKDTKPGEINGLPMTYEINGTLLSDIKVNKATGWISEVKLKQLLKGNIEIFDNPKMAGGMTIPVIFNSEVITTDSPQVH